MDLADYLTATAPRPASDAPAPLSPDIIADTDTRWPVIPPLEFLPNGQPLRCTLRRSLIMADIFGATHAPFPGILSAVFLYLCAHPAGAWSHPVTMPDGDTRPLWRAPDHLIATALQWAETALPHLTPTEMANLSTRLWLYHDATRVTAENPDSSQKKSTSPASSPPGMTSGSTSPPEEIPSEPSGASITSPSGNST